MVSSFALAVQCCLLAMLLKNKICVDGNLISKLFRMRRKRMNRNRQSQVPVSAPITQPIPVSNLNGIKLPFRLNCGNATNVYTDPTTGLLWNRDNYHPTSGTVTNNACQAAASSGFKLPTHLCQSRMAEKLIYNIPVPFKGSYIVTLYLVELVHKSTGKRILSIAGEGVTLINKMDVFAVAGGLYKPISRSFSVNVQDGTLSIEATSHVKGIRAMINAIQIEAAPAPAPKGSIVRINCGGFVNWTDPLTQNVWMGDIHYKGGFRYLACPPGDILNTRVDEVHCSERNWFGKNATGSYTIPVLPGQYTVRLMFAEVFFRQPNSRLFDVYIQNQLIRRNFDIFGASGGANISYTVSSTAVASPTDPNIYILLQNVLQNAKISAIEIVPYTKSDVKPPTPKPSRRPTQQPTSNDVFRDILINCGYDATFSDSLAQNWSPDNYFTGGLAYSLIKPVSNTVDDVLFQHFRTGDQFAYQIPVPVGTYAVMIHFAETQYTGSKQRVFDVQVEEQTLTVDIFQLAGGAADKATRIQFFQVVEDGFLSIKFRKSIQFPNSGVPVVSAIEIILDKPHIAHAVATGPYQGVVTDKNLNKGPIRLIGQTSHTHGDGLSITSYTWKEGNTILGTQMNTNYTFDVGLHTVGLTIRDSGGNIDTEVTTVNIKPFGFPAIASISPNSGALAGQYNAVIKGSGFDFGSDKLKVRFGKTEVSGSNVKILDPTTIQVTVPPSAISQDVIVTIQTPIGTSSGSEFSYVGSIPVQWQEGLILEYLQPAVGRFAQDRKLYVGTRRGRILKITMNEDFTVALNTIVSFVNPENQEAV
jgi:Malectin domain/IPT/TIG domain